MRRRANDRSLICVCQPAPVAASLCRGAARTLRQARHDDAAPWLRFPPISIPRLRNRFSQSWRIYCKTRVALPSDSELRNSGHNLREIIATRRALLIMRKLVFVDCQLGLKEGKMKGSTKPQRMDEPFYS